MNFEPPEPNDYGHCLRCGTFVIEEEQKNGICIDCQGGGAAFPQSGYEQWAPQGGMFLRDYFAAKAMQSVIGSNRPEGWNIGAGGRDNGHIAEISYALADAMLLERAK